MLPCSTYEKKIRSISVIVEILQSKWRRLSLLYDLFLGVADTIGYWLLCICCEYCLLFFFLRDLVIASSAKPRNCLNLPFQMLSRARFWCKYTFKNTFDMLIKMQAIFWFKTKKQQQPLNQTTTKIFLPSLYRNSAALKKFYKFPLTYKLKTMLSGTFVEAVFYIYKIEF